MAKNVTYGPGGYDPDRPDDNIVAAVDAPDPEAPAADVVAVIESMTPAQLDAMRQLLGIG